MGENEIIVSPSSIEIIQEEAEFGKLIRRAIRVCPVCMRADHMEISRMRAVNHMTYKDISIAKGISQDSIRLHFTKHFMISERNQQILDLRENNSPEALELVTKILDGKLDLYTGSKGILQDQAQRVHMLRKRLEYLEERKDQSEIPGSPEVEDVEIQEAILIHREIDNIQAGMTKLLQIIDKKCFPFDDEQRSRAVLQFKYDILSKFVDEIITIFFEFEKKPEFTELIPALRNALVPKVNRM